MANDQSTESYPSPLENESFILTSTEVIDAFGLECGVCKESFQLDGRSPKLLPCGHSFCLPCLQELSRSRSSQYTTIPCPSCRVQVSRDVNALPTDHRIIRGLGVISKAKARSRNVCFKHGFQHLKYFCKTCAVPICNDCSVLCHREADGHVIVDLAEELQATKNQLHDREKALEANLMKMKIRHEAMTNVEKSLSGILSQEKNKIEACFERYNNLLAERKANLIAMIEGKVTERKATINNEALQLQKRMSVTKKVSNNSKCARESNDVRAIFKAEESTNMQVNNSNDDDKNPIGSLCVSYEFDPCHEKSFMEEINRIGDIIDKLDFSLQRTVEDDAGGLDEDDAGGSDEDDAGDSDYLPAHNFGIPPGATSSPIVAPTSGFSFGATNTTTTCPTNRPKRR